MRSLKRSMCSAILGLEAVVMLLTWPIMTAQSDVRWQIALAIGVGLMLLCILVAGSLRFRPAYAVGWAIQLVALALGFVVPVMFFLGFIFLILWTMSYILGTRIDVERAQREAPEGPATSAH